MTNLNREELAWAAGLFDGEGYIGCRIIKRTRGGWPQGQLKLSISQNDRQVLDRFQLACGGLGKVLGPYKSCKPGNIHYDYQTQKFETVQQVICLLWPWLSPVKKQQATNACRKIRSYFKELERYA